MKRDGTIEDFRGYGSPGDTGTKEDGQRATHPLGIRFQGPWEAPSDGFPEHVRRNARALAMTGCPVHLASLKATFHHYEDGSDEERVFREHKHLANASISRYGAIVQMLVPTEGLLERLITPSQMAMRALGMDDYLLLQSTKIFYTVWERYPVPESDAAVLAKVGQAWVPSEASRTLLVEAKVPEAKVRVVPMPVFADDPLLALDGRERQPGVPRFYHIGKWEPRKDQHRILGNFLRAFRPGEAVLMLKSSAFASSAGDYPPSVLPSVMSWMADPRVRDNGWRWPAVPAREIGTALSEQGLEIFEAKVSARAIQRIHELGDIYVSLSHGEGWDMPAFDAKIAGNLLVHTPSGGPQEFAGALDLCVPQAGSIPCHPLYHWPKGSSYLDYDDDEAVLALQMAARRIEEGKRQRGMSLERFEAKRVGALMLRHLREIAPALPGET